MSLTENFTHQQKFTTAKEAAKMVGYTSDYVTRLAREGKVVAYQEGRQWFIDSDSVKLFELETKKEKTRRQEQLREERKREMLANQLHTEQASRIEDFDRGKLIDVYKVGVLLMASLLFVCVFTLGFFRFTDAKSGWQFAAAGFGLGESQEESVVSLQQIEPDPTTNPERQSTASNQVRRPNTGVVVFDEDVADETVDQVRQYFSDEVRVSFEDEDSGMITPIFRERASTSYRFLLVPVNDFDPGSG